jgi:hypothetical protein
MTLFLFSPRENKRGKTALGFASLLIDAGETKQVASYSGKSKYMFSTHCREQVQNTTPLHMYLAMTPHSPAASEETC